MFVSLKKAYERGHWFQNDLNIFLYIWQLIRNNEGINSRSVYYNKAHHTRTKASALQISPDVQENLPDPFCF